MNRYRKKYRKEIILLILLKILIVLSLYFLMFEKPHLIIKKNEMFQQLTSHHQHL